MQLFRILPSLERLDNSAGKRLRPIARRGEEPHAAERAIPGRRLTLTRTAWRPRPRWATSVHLHTLVNHVVSPGSPRTAIPLSALAARLASLRCSLAAEISDMAASLS